MSPLSIVHVLIGLLAVIIGFVIFARRKGDARHRAFGWVFVACILVSLAAIIIRGLSKPSPFLVYAAVIFASVIAAILLSRYRDRIPGWRAWHAALMSFAMLAALVAIGGVIGGVALGLGTGPEYFRMFNLVIIAITVAGLWIINTRPVIWGHTVAARERAVRIRATAYVVAVTLALVAGQAALWKLY